MNILTFSTLFPNAEKPGHGIFVENRLRHLVASGQVNARVVAPVPWFPSAHPRFGAWGRMAKVPRSEVRHGLQVAHPRYITLPKVGMNLTSSREGWAIVLLEAITCGAPVVPSPMYGMPEVAAAPEADILMNERSARGMADAVNALRDNHPDRGATRHAPYATPAAASGLRKH